MYLFGIQNKTQLTQLLIGWAIFLTFVCGFLMQSVDWFRATPGDLADPRFNSYLLEHVWLWLMGISPNLWSPNFYYPFNNILGFSDNFFGSFFIYGFFRSLGFNRPLAFDAWFVVGSILNYIASYWAFRLLKLSVVSSALGSFVFAASLPNLSVDNSVQLVYRFAVPLAWTFFYLAYVNKRPLFFALTALCIAEQFYCSIYVGIFLIYLLVFTYIGLRFVKPNPLEIERQKYSAFESIFSLLVIICAGIAVGLILLQYHDIAQQYGLSRSAEEVISGLPKISSYFLSDRSPLGALWGLNLVDFSHRQENQLFIGVGTTVFVFYGIKELWNSSLPKYFKQIGRIALIAMGLLILGTLQINGHSIYNLFLNLPGITAIRAVGRIILVILFPISLLVAIGNEALDKKLISYKNYLKLTIVGIVILLITVESCLSNHDRTPITFWNARMQRLVDLMPNSMPQDPILFVQPTYAEKFIFSEIDGMLFAQDLNLPTLNGYSGSLPPNYPKISGSIQERLDAFAKFNHTDLDWAQKTTKRIVNIQNNGPWLIKNTPVDKLNQVISFSSENNTNQLFLLSGWAMPEPWGTWAIGNNSALILPIPKGVARELILKVRFFINEQHPQLNLSYSVNNDPPKQVVAGLNTANTFLIPITAEISNKGFVSVQFYFANPASPKDLGLGDDIRALTLGLESAQFH